MNGCVQTMTAMNEDDGDDRCACEFYSVQYKGPLAWVAFLGRVHRATFKLEDVSHGAWLWAMPLYCGFANGNLSYWAC